MFGGSLNRRMAVRPGDDAASARIGAVGLDAKIELEALRLYGLPEAAPAQSRGAPTLPVGRREFAAATGLDLPSSAKGAPHPVDPTGPGARQGECAEASLLSPPRLIRP